MSTGHVSGSTPGSCASRIHFFLTFLGDEFSVPASVSLSHSFFWSCALPPPLLAAFFVAFFSPPLPPKADLPTMPLNIALHRGEVLYGNVGSTNRLDFTMIGPAVNLASRIEGMCGPLERNLLISDAFASAMPDHGAELLSLGKHGLRSVREPVRLYTVADLPDL